MSTDAAATVDDLLAELRAGRTIEGGPPLLAVMHRVSQGALRITAELNGSYHDEAGVRALLSELIGAPVPDSVVVFPPFRADFGRNIRIGEGVFINSGCAFQDQGGVTIGDGAVIAAASVVTRDVPPRTIAVGSPARVVRAID
jgi:acetyltransferase-like isoleucine patch superfamily enzyme